MTTKFEMLAGTYLTMTSRIACRVCHMAGKRGDDANVIPAARLRELRPANKGSQFRQVVTKATYKHYRHEHPEVKLP